MRSPAAAVLALPLLAGCAATAPDPAGRTGRWEAVVTARGVDPARVPAPLTATEEMRAFAAAVAPERLSAPDRLTALQRALYDPERFTFAYDERGTFSAADAFARRRGNCVAFTNLFLALGRSLGFPLVAALATESGTVEREGDLIVVRTHVVATLPWGSRTLVFDFFDAESDPSLGVRPVDDAELAAVYLGNLGVDELRAGRAERALAVLSDAVRLGPSLAPIHVDLGVALWHLGREADAETAFRTARARDPREPSALHDLAALLASQGRHDEALRLLRGADMRGSPGPTWLLRGNVELAEREVDGAARSFREAARRMPRSVEPLLALARAEEARGRRAEAAAALREALARKPDDPDVKRLLDLP